MRRALSLLNQNCRCAARLISDEMERDLSRLERTGLTIHLAGCGACRRYRRQARMLEQLVTTNSVQNDSRLSESARDRIMVGLTQQAGSD